MDSRLRALWLTGRDGPQSLQLREGPLPIPGAGEVRIQVKACGVNFADILASHGLYPDAPRTPCVLGYEVSGIVDAVGANVETAVIGTRVLSMTKFGGYADVVCVPAQDVAAMPEAMTFEEGAALPINYVTAYHMLHRIARIQPGELVLVHQAAGGVGIAALQLCRTIPDITTFGTASRAKHDALKAQGCRYPIDYHSTNYAKEIRRLTGGAGVDVVLDALGGSDWRKGYELLKPGGRLICFGFANLSVGPKRNMLRVLGQLWRVPKFSPLKLMSDNRVVAGVNVGHLDADQAVLHQALKAIIELYKSGAVKPVIDAVVPFSQAASGLERLRDGKNVGKVVLVPN